MKDIKGYEGLYAITSCGRVWSYRSKRFLTPIKSKNYLRVCLAKNGIHKKFFIHRLVMETYCPIEGMENLEVGHLDEIGIHNYLNNLRWMTHTENINFGNRNERSAKKHRKVVLCIETQEVFESMTAAAKSKSIPLGNISRACNGKLKTAGGYHWEFI